MTYQSFEFTAFTEADLLSGGNTDIGCGDTFIMPAAATTCFTVYDNDCYLSGDSYCNENADDQYGQQATIEGENGALGNGGQIYAEVYYWVHDQYGNWYVMIEIEQEGTGGDYFTFLSSYGVPPAGSQLTVHSSCNVVDGGWNPSYKDLSAGEKVETGSISGTVFCDIDCDGINGEVTVIPGETYTVEAEDMIMCGFTRVYGSHASGGKLVKLETTGYSDWDGYLKTDFKGQDGTYDIKIRVQDENDGQSTIWVKVNGQLVKAIKLDRDSDGGGSNNGGFSTYVIKNVELDTGDEFKLVVNGDNCEFVRIDKIDFVGAPKTVVTNEPTKAGVVIKLLDLDGNVVAETKTDANGNYKFDDIPVGDYKIMGVAPDGTEFTIQDAGSDDSRDSDVDGSGTSGVVTVTKDGNADIDLGVCDKPLGSLGGRYFCDEDNNSIDNGEPGIPNATVWLIKVGSGVIADTTTDANGNYLFTGLEEGDYIVRFEDPNDVAGAEGKVFVDPNVGLDDTVDSDVETIGASGNGNTGTISLAAGENKRDVDAGIEDPGTAAITGRYFCDENDNDRDDGEPPIVGAEVKLLNAAGVVVATTFTLADGTYAFTGLDAGTYSVIFAADASGKTFVNRDVGDDIDDSDVDPATGQTGPIVVQVGETSANNDAGVEDPKTASVGNQVWFDANGDGILNNGEAGVDGVEVKLLADLDGDGEIDDVVDTMMTANGGFYLFENLHAGDYSIMFTAPDGLEFTVASPLAADDLNNDSDARAGGMTDVFNLSIGEAERDIDAGLIRSNGDPEPQDDAAKTCADETVMVDVLANDSDPDSDVLTISAVDGQAITEGATVTTASGVNVTLQGGKLVVDGEAAYAFLDIGQEAIENISYTVSDGQGGSVSANLAVTFCGDANSVQTLCDTLPDGEILYKVQSSNIEFPVEDYAFNIQFTNTGDARFDGVIFEAAYCLDRGTPVARAEQFEDAPINTGSMYCVTEADAATLFGPAQVSVFNGLDAAENLDLINWILNQEFEENGFTGWEVQRAIWELTNSDDLAFLDAIDPGFGQDANVDAILSQAAANGEGFEAGVGDVIGVIIDPGNSNPANQQPFIIAMNFEDYDCLC